MRKQEFIVIEDKTLSSEYETRYVVVNPETGEVLDDAQGYGFKTRESAYRCYGFKQNHDNSKQYKKDMKKTVRDFIKANKAVFDELFKRLDWALKDHHKVENKEIKKFLNDNGVELPFTVRELKRFW